jgi:hypothetical protein
MSTNNLYGKAFANLLGGEVSGDAFAIDYLSDTIKIALLANAYTQNLDTHETFADITDEVTGTGYTAGGATLASKTITYTAANSWGTAWATNTAYVAGDVVRPTSGNGHLFRCIVAGTSHASTEPTWPTTSGATVTDNTVTWAEIGRGITVIDAADPSWTTATISGIRKAVVYKDSGTANTSPLICLMVFDSDIAVVAGTFTVTLPVLGILDFSTP